MIMSDVAAIIHHIKYCIQIKLVTTLALPGYTLHSSFSRGLTPMSYDVCNLVTATHSAQAKYLKDRLVTV